MWFAWRNTKAEPRVDFITNLAITAFCFLFPFWQYKHLIDNRKLVMDDKVFDQRFGSLYTNIETGKLEALVFSFVFLVRRLAFAFVICQIFSTIVVQVMALDALSTAMLVYYLANRPMKDRTNNFIQIFNELVILVSIEMMFLFTDYVGDPL